MARVVRTTKALEPDPTTITKLEKLVGGITLGIFVLIWISSIASPFVLVYAIWNGYYVLATFIIIVTFAAYLPWRNKGSFVRLIRQFINHYSSCYYQSLVMEFEGDHIPNHINTNNNTSQMSTDPQTFYAIHPHGAFCIGWAMLFSHDDMQDVRFCFSPALYISPFFRLFSRCTGNPGSANKHAMSQYLRHGESVALPPGGFEEATLTCQHQDRVFIKKRTGFIKLCLQHGVPHIRPVYVFGEKSLYWNIQGKFQTRLWWNRFGIPTILTWGHPLFPLVPKNTVDIRIVVGRPLVLPQNLNNPTKDDVIYWHGKYVDALTQLYERHKEIAYGSEIAKTSKLEVW